MIHAIGFLLDGAAQEQSRAQARCDVIFRPGGMPTPEGIVKNV
jgi:hypothetical protein